MTATNTRSTSFPLFAAIVLFSALSLLQFSQLNLNDSQESPNNQNCIKCPSSIRAMQVQPPSPILVECLQSSNTSSFFETLTGPGFYIYRPWDLPERDALQQTERLLASPEVWIAQLHQKFKRLDQMTATRQDKRSLLERSKSAYLQTLQQFVTGLLFGIEEKTIGARLGTEKLDIYDYTEHFRTEGLDWTYLGTTMTGLIRIRNVKDLIQKVILNNVPGDYLEAGVWRGGSSIFARGVLRAWNQGHRKSYVCDSFQGLPPGDKNLHPKDKNWDNTPYLAVSDTTVATSFREASLLDENVIFAKGFFNDSLKPLAQQIKSLAVLRLDGDMYESTVDILYHLYNKVSIGGYVIMDDWDNFPSQSACLDFFAVHNLQPKIVRIDQVSVYWQKTKRVKVQYWRYTTSQFKP